MPSALSFSLFIFFVCGELRCFATAATFRLDLYHRYSDRVRTWSESASGETRRWPEKETLDYYVSLAAQDHELLHRRGLVEAAGNDLTFALGNATVELSALGFLHYAFVNLGTPDVTFLVAMDTGSDLLWVPCDCQNCSPTNNDIYNITLNIFSSASSKTSKKVPCSSSICKRRTSCSSSTDACPYRIRYLSAGTSTSGTLLEDVLHLITDDLHQDAVQARIIFGCGQFQTGSFLRSGAPNGIFGLGLDNISVLSLLASSGLTSNAFSMCFGSNGIGRITFGDRGSSDQDTTPFHRTGPHPSYNITVTGMSVGSSLLGVNFSALYDSGTSFTILSDPAYSLLASTFDSLAPNKQMDTGPDFLFDYCYAAAPDALTMKIPNISLIMEGGKEYPVLHPLVMVKQVNGSMFYCLAVLKTRFHVNIIGQNFMTGLKVVFDREQLLLGWRTSNCYDDDNSIPPLADPTGSSAFPTAAIASRSSPLPQNGNARNLSTKTFPCSFLLYCSLLTILLLTY